MRMQYFLEYVYVLISIYINIFSHEFVLIFELVGSWGVTSISITLVNMWTPEVVQLKSGITIVVELNHALYSYVVVAHIYDFDS